MKRTHLTVLASVALVAFTAALLYVGNRAPKWERECMRVDEATTFCRYRAKIQPALVEPWGSAR